MYRTREWDSAVGVPLLVNFVGFFGGVVVIINFVTSHFGVFFVLGLFFRGRGWLSGSSFYDF